MVSNSLLVDGVVPTDMAALLVDLMTEFVSSKSSTHIKKGFRSFGNLN